MPRAKAVTPHTQELIRIMGSTRLPNGEAKYTHSEIASCHGVSRPVVSKILAKAPQTYPPQPPERRGRKPVLSDRQKRHIMREFAKDPDVTCTKIVRICKLSVSPQTVRRFLRSSGAAYAKIPTAPRLTPAHKAARVSFASEHLLAETDFSTWIFSDEKRFNLDGPDGLRYRWMFPGQEKAVLSKRAFGGGSIMVWGGIAGSHKVALVEIQSNMNSEVYQSMLEMNLLPFLEAGEEEGIEYTFQQDNARPHVSSSTKEWLARNGVTTVQWPAVSPDLNCIEHCWGRMALAVYGGGRGPYSTKDELRQAIFKAWDDLTPEDISTLTKSTRSRCVEAIKCQGGPTRYC
ncbi:Transposable element Tc3 transposase, putative [Perkinsus marinus ATCC 50983]|uniref:Transposable element Tc3 transposase, putative n=1 Tax=Perkinsus marinus (strain ATCC 50983 / TXsc) TaxID=423536 RepID=C5LC31_PERM5|nr:Transposable element Tc3 transposase, putative [Perkinsus marinus ATCC 50983]EER05514.1 Transposable element Tc3 transposase, putative [Perkinsus marinus ATCC 50983]|eukprot:XP_002773698.1 Transposable element Tc3 transposase, putative [Perkinsus marinus ATCC 50983]